jgi:stress response protein YsnF
MIRTVTALFDDTDEAEAALARLTRAVPIMKAGIVTCGPGERPEFGAIYLSRTQREACEAELADGGSLLIAQVEGDQNAEQAVDLLDRLGQGQAPAPSPRRGAAPPAASTAPPRAPKPAADRPSAPPPAASFGDDDLPEMPMPAAAMPIPADRVEGIPVSTTSRRPAPEAAPPPMPAAAEPQAAVVAAEPVELEAPTIPLVEEELRIGKRSVLRGGARVHSYVEEVPVVEEIELIVERTHVERRPVDRQLTDEEIEASGLLRNRVVEITQMREEAVLTKESFVREELVVKKTVEKRVEQIRDTVRRTAVEVERLEPEYADGNERRG